MFRSFLLAVGLAAALSFGAGAQTQNPPHKTPPYTRPPETTAPQAEQQQTVMVTGCVERGTQPRTYVLAAQQTPLSSQMSQHLGGDVPTPEYQLFGHTSELEGMVGHRVQVKGTTNRQPEQTVQTGKDTRAEAPKAQGTSGKPTVTTDTKEKVELRRLDVQAVTAVQGACK